MRLLIDSRREPNYLVVATRVGSSEEPTNPFPSKDISLQQ